MKLIPADKRTGATAIRLTVSLAIATLLPPLLYGSTPAWWSQHGVLLENAVPDDYAPANQGQVKNIASAAVAEMDAKLPGGAGTILYELINSWSTPIEETNDFPSINLGQLKKLPKPFYDRLIVAGLATQYPWTSSLNHPDDFAVANIGQVKNLFGFELSAVDPLYAVLGAIRHGCCVFGSRPKFFAVSQTMSCKFRPSVKTRQPRNLPRKPSAV